MPCCNGTQHFGTVLFVPANNLAFSCTCGSLRESYQAAVREHEGGNEPTTASGNLVFYNAHTFPQAKGNSLFLQS